MIKGHDVICWGSGEFGQHGHNLIPEDVSFENGQLYSPEISGRVKMAACGSTHALVVTVDDKIFAWGNNSSGQLGSTELSDDQNIVRLTLVPPPPDDATVASVACGHRHSMIVLDNGHIYCCGNNFYAQLGYDFKREAYKENQKIPGLLRFLVHNPVSQVSCGDKHTLVLYRSGTVAAVGHNEHGQIGDGGRGESAVPKLVDLDCKVVSIACGSNHSLAVSDSGDVYVWGYSKGCGRKHHDVLNPEPKLRNRQVIQASGGSTHSLALTGGGDVWSWGYGSHGQLGLGQNVLSSPTPREIRHSSLRHRVSDISCGETFSAAVACDGQLYMWGKNCHVISSVHTPTTPFYVPTSVGAHTSNVHSVFCGAWHALVLLGHPERQPVIDRHGEDDSDTDSFSEDLHSVSDSDISGISDTFNSETDNIEKSIPPIGHSTHQVSSNNSQNAGTPKKGLPFQGLQSRGQTRLTLAEFYDLSDSSTDQKDSPRYVASNHKNEDAPTSGTVSSLRTQQNDIQSRTLNSKIEMYRNSHESSESRHNNVNTSFGVNERSLQDLQDQPSSTASRNRHVSNYMSQSITANGAVITKVKGQEPTNEVNTEGHESTPEFSISVSTGQQLKKSDYNEKSKNLTPNPRPVRPLQNNTSIDYLREKSKLSSMGVRANTMFISTRTSERYALPRDSAREKKSSVSLVDINQLQGGVLGNERKKPSMQSTRLDTVVSSTRQSSASTSVNNEVISSMRRDSASVGKYPREATTGNRSKTPQARMKASSPSPIQAHFGLQIRGYENRSSAQDSVVAQPHTKMSLGFNHANLGPTDVNLMRSNTVWSQMDRVSKCDRRPALPSAGGQLKKTLQTPGQSTYVGRLYPNAETLDSQTTKNDPATRTKKPSTTQIVTLPGRIEVTNREVTYSRSSSRPSRDTDSSDDPKSGDPQGIGVSRPRQTLTADQTGIQAMTIEGCGTRSPVHKNGLRRGFSETKKLLTTKRDGP